MQSIKCGRVLGYNIRRVRINHSLTQEQVSARMQVNGIDISRATYAKIESGIRHISLQELRMVKAILNMEYDDFFMDLQD